MLPRILLRRQLFGRAVLVRRSYTTQPPAKLDATPTEADIEIEKAEAVERARTMQAPNRAMTWSATQNPREVAMAGPRFEQTVLEAQPRPYAAIELIHEQPVRFVDKRMAVCDGGGGPAGHPKIFINVDKPEIVPCGYCGLPYAYSHHRHYLESLPSTEFPLS
ncbi:NADH:ubiquinone oxidoreductase 18.4kD subunit [Terfezia boudieri ATCC MYA-4762]|uniref:NADH:ubiquinone oxidoreductase 18.4kD subunit n=1 Tax=Terfezia boudieri ATCC MYA-4762 TaxID=1051890 RepID=A0A3N4LVV6_9PEZI|nr:NADH:ubiquinone oxidoreductase 18.4kD subunit [Terfezia boudieri ATCC MYA-4762]